MENLETTSILALDLRHYAESLSSTSAKYFKPPVNGFYHIRNLLPSLLEGKEYYYKDGSVYFSTGVYDNIVGDLYDDCGRMVLLHSEYLKDNYTIMPVVPIMELNGIVTVIKEYLHECVSHTFTQGFDHSDYCSERYEQQSIVTNIELKVAPIFKDISRFIDNDTWHIYTVSVLDYTVFINKHIDYRIYDWNKRYAEESV